MKTQTKIILYVDDEQANLNAFQLLFGKKYHVLVADNCSVGLTLLEENDVYLVISDQKMPSMKGIDFLQIVKKKWPEVLSILLTGFVDKEALETAINKVGIYQYISKPFDPIQMELVIDKALDSYQMKKSLNERTMELALSEAKLSKIIESAADAIITMDGDKNIVMANDATSAIFGYSNSELLNLTISTLIPGGL